MVTDSYSPSDQRIFRDGMKTLNDVTQQAHKVDFMTATPEQRLAVLTQLDREQKRHMDARDAAVRAKRGLPPVPVTAEAGEAGKEGDAYVSDQRQENTAGSRTNAAPAITSPRNFCSLDPLPLSHSPARSPSIIVPSVGMKLRVDQPPSLKTKGCSRGKRFKNQTSKAHERFEFLFQWERNPL